MPLTITHDIYRRFIMAMQGLWPGRRWQGHEGVTQALRQCEAIQIDPISVLHRSHDLALWGRVLDYAPDMLSAVMYEDRAFFDWGGILMVLPMEELPYWRGGPMREMLNYHRVRTTMNESGEVVDEVRAALRERWPLGNRDFEGGNTLATRVFRPGKLTGRALQSLWLTGEIMTHSRRNQDRLYALTEHVAPTEYQWVARKEEAEAFFARKVTRMLGMTTEKELRGMMGPFEYKLTDKAKRQLKAMLDAGEVTEARVEHIKQPCYLMAEALPLLEDLMAGRVPAAWQPIGPTTLDEVTFLAPLEMVSARGRAKTVFGFEYIWEVYKPAEKRRWGYYVLPILYGDQLVARMDAKLDRQTMTLSIPGFWLEAQQAADDPDFAAALGRGLARFARFHEAASLDLSGIAERGLREAVGEMAALQANGPR